jgi:anti-sigma regulatory factor (Ser/Thr protein kinase)
MHEDTPTVELPARFSSLEVLLGRVASACRGAGLQSEFYRRAELAVEELFANTIHHAYRGESDRPVWLQVSATGTGVCVEYQDAGPPFDPFNPEERPAGDPLPKPPSGGHGRSLIRELATISAYKRLNGRNVVSLEFLLNAS